MRINLATKKQRKLTAHYGRPIMGIIEEWLRAGQSVAECARRITEESGESVSVFAIYEWLQKVDLARHFRKHGIEFDAGLSRYEPPPPS